MEEIKQELEKILTKERYLHSLGAMKAAGELARIYGENEEEAKLAGLVHDIAKELSKKEIEKALEKYKIEVEPPKFDEVFTPSEYLKQIDDYLDEGNKLRK